MMLYAPSLAAIGFNRDMLDMLRHAGWVAWLVLGVLLLQSVLSWAVIVFKWQQFRGLMGQDERFAEAFRRCKSLKEADTAAGRYEGSVLAALYRSAYAELGKQPAGKIYLRPLERSMRRTQRVEAERLKRRLALLATVAASAPFIGLFGTVWGILNAFHKIGAEGAAHISAVAPGISEALIATAAGLAAAIPAVFGYNYMLAQHRGRVADMDAFILECLTLIENAAMREGTLGD